MALLELKDILPANLGSNRVMWFLISVTRLISSGGVCLRLPASILASWSKSRTSLLA